MPPALGRNWGRAVWRCEPGRKGISNGLRGDRDKTADRGSAKEPEGSGGCNWTGDTGATLFVKTLENM